MAQPQQRRGRERVRRPLGDEQVQRVDGGRGVAGPVVQVDAVPQGRPVALVVRQRQCVGLGHAGVAGVDQHRPHVLGAAGGVGGRLPVSGGRPLDLVGPALEDDRRLVEEVGRRLGRQLLLLVEQVQRGGVVAARRQGRRPVGHGGGSRRGGRRRRVGQRQPGQLLQVRHAAGVIGSDMIVQSGQPAAEQRRRHLRTAGMVDDHVGVERGGRPPVLAVGGQLAQQAGRRRRPAGCPSGAVGGPAAAAPRPRPASPVLSAQ